MSELSLMSIYACIKLSYKYKSHYYLLKKQNTSVKNYIQNIYVQRFNGLKPVQNKTFIIKSVSIDAPRRRWHMPIFVLNEFHS